MRYSVIRSLMRRILRSENTDSAAATANVIRRLVSPCPACGKEHLKRGDGHEYAQFAVEIARESSVELSRFFQLYQAHEWSNLNRIQRFEGSSNLAEVIALRCTGGVTMLAVRAPAELFESDSLLNATVLDQAESETVQSLPITFQSI
jgi:hypothetical protein